MSERADRLIDAPERRSLAVTDFELRTDHAHGLTLEGYASVFEAEYEVLGGPPMGWTEVVDRRAFDVTLREKPDVHLLINHEGLPLARTKSGTLALSTDKVGLRVRADLDRRDPDVQALEVKMGRRDMDEMSFAFRVKDHDFDKEKGYRRLLEVSLHKGDVSVVNFGANPATSAALRALVEQLADIQVEEQLAEARSMDRDRMRDAYHNLGRIIRESTPEERRTLTVSDAVNLIDGKA